MLYGILNCFWGYALKVEAAREGAFTSIDGALPWQFLTKMRLRFGKLEICRRKIK